MLRQREPNVRPIAIPPPFLLGMAVAAVVLLVAACGGGSSSSSTPTDQASTTPQTSGSGTPAPTGSPLGTPVSTEGLPPDCAAVSITQGVITQLTFDQNSGVYAAGAPITMTFVVSNCGAEDAKLSYPTTQRYVFIVADGGGNEMWRSTDGNTYGQTEGSETIGAKKAVQYNETWDQKDRSGKQVPNGQYKVSAFSVGCIAVARSNCEFGPIRFVQIGPVTSTTAATPAPATAGG